MASVRFYFDYISSNAYLAWVVLPKLAEQYGASLELVPTLFAGYLKANGQLGPAEIPPKMFWMSKNNLRKATLLGVPLNPPLHHPFNPLLALRVSSLPMEEEERHALVTGLFDAVWVNGLHVSEPEVVAQIASGVGLDGASLVQQAQQPEAKSRLRDQTDDAIARGVFGVPSMQIGEEIFWGYDDLAFVELHLAGKDPLPAGAHERWRENRPTPSAMRAEHRKRLS